MKHKNHVPFLAFVVALLLLTVGVIVLAQTSADFDLSWHVVGSGGRQSSSADYRIEGTIGQSLASPPQSDRANFSVSSGYWIVEENRVVYLPMVIKN